MKAYIERVVDADTLQVTTEQNSDWADLGLGHFVSSCFREKTKVRLARINAPENSTSAGKLSTAWARQELAGYSSVNLDVIGYDKYGRVLAEVTYGDKNLSNELLASSHAVAYGRDADDDSPIQPVPW